MHIEEIKKYHAEKEHLTRNEGAHPKTHSKAYDVAHNDYEMPEKAEKGYSTMLVENTRPVIGGKA